MQSVTETSGSSSPAVMQDVAEADDELQLQPLSQDQCLCGARASDPHRRTGLQDRYPTQYCDSRKLSEQMPHHYTTKQA